MTQQKPTKNEVAFNLIIDKERCEVLQVMMSCTMMNIVGFTLAHPDRAPVVLSSMKKLLQEVAEKQHEMGWCNDSDCEWESHKKSS